MAASEAMDVLFNDVRRAQAEVALATAHVIASGGGLAGLIDMILLAPEGSSASLAASEAFVTTPKDSAPRAGLMNVVLEDLLEDL